MSPRPRQASNEDILKAAFRAIARVGPARLTLSDVARAAGVSAPAVVQRFGSRRELLLAAAADAATGSDYIFPALREQHRSPVAALLALADCMTLMGSTPNEVANSLAFMRMDLTDGEFQRHAAAGSQRMHDGIKSLVSDGIKAGELRPCNTSRFAWALLAVLNGALVNWTVHREGKLSAWIRRDLKTVLEPYVADRLSARSRRRLRKNGRPASTKPRTSSAAARLSHR